MTAQPDTFELLATSRLCKIPHCGQRFTPSRHNHVYCSAKCRMKQYEVTPLLEPRACQRCRKTFQPLRKTHRWCSDVCKDRHIREHSICESYIDVETLSELKAHAARLERSLSYVARLCVESGLKKLKEMSE